MNITEKIIASHCNKSKVQPGEIVEVDVDFCMANDVTIPLTIDIFENEFGFTKVWDPKKIVFIHDHRIPADSLDTTLGHVKGRQFVKKHQFKLHENDGVCHQIMLESYVNPGDLIVAADSHTCSYGCVGVVSTGMGSTDIAAVMGSGKTWLKVPETIRIGIMGTPQTGVYAKDIILYIIKTISASGASYKAVEFTGETISKMSISERFTLCNMVIEAGGKSAMIKPDSKVAELFGKNNIPQELFQDDPHAQYSETYTFDVSDLTPQVACPHKVDAVVPVETIINTKIDQAFLGSCTNGRLDDLTIAAKMIKGKKVHPDVRFLVTPASVSIYSEALKQGILETFINAGAIINHPGCSTCWGACQGVLAEGQKMISTANRNFKGRAGSADSEIYLASPATVTASAIEGYITNPLTHLEGSYALYR